MAGLAAGARRLEFDFHEAVLVLFGSLGALSVATAILAHRAQRADALAISPIEEPAAAIEV